MGLEQTASEKDRLLPRGPDCRRFVRDVLYDRELVSVLVRGTRCECAATRIPPVVAKPIKVPGCHMARHHSGA